MTAEELALLKRLGLIEYQGTVENAEFYTLTGNGRILLASAERSEALANNRPKRLNSDRAQSNRVRGVRNGKRKATGS